MKRFLLSLAITTLSLCSFANSSTTPLSTGYDNILVYIDLGDITNISETDVSNRVNAPFTDIRSDSESVTSYEELTCTVKVSGSVGVGSNKISIDITISGPCSEVQAEAKKLLKAIKKEVKDLL